MLWFDQVNLITLLIIWVILLTDIKSHILARKYWILFFTAYTLTEMLSLPIAWLSQNNMVLYNIGTPIQFLFLVIYFSRCFSRSGKTSAIYLLPVFVYVIVVIIYKIKTHSLDDPDFQSPAFYGAINSFFCLAYFNIIIKSSDYIMLENSEFWYISALFVLYLSNFVNYGCMTYFIKIHSKLAGKLFYIIVINSYLFYALTLFAIIAEKKLWKNG